MGGEQCAVDQLADQPLRPGSRFHLERYDDVSGQSGIGVVAHGIVFPSGKVALCWDLPPHSVAVYDRIEDVEQVHGHAGRTLVVFDDQGGAAPAL